MKKTLSAIVGFIVVALSLSIVVFMGRGAGREMGVSSDAGFDAGVVGLDALQAGLHVTASGPTDASVHAGLTTSKAILISLVGATHSRYSWQLTTPPGSTTKISTNPDGSLATAWPDIPGLYTIALQGKSINATIQQTYNLVLSIARVYDTTFTGPLHVPVLSANEVSTPADGKTWFSDRNNGGALSWKNPDGTVGFATGSDVSLGGDIVGSYADAGVRSIGGVPFALSSVDAGVGQVLARTDAGAWGPSDTVQNSIVSQRVISVATIGDLRLISGSAGQSVQLRGYYADQDGGGGLFDWNSSSSASDNAGTIIAPTGVSTGRWLRRYSGAVNVRWCGAQGDNSTDDASAIRACYAIGAPRGALFFPQGTYYVASSIDLNTSYVRIEGESVRLTVIYAAPGVHVFHPTASLAGLVIEHMQFATKYVLTDAGIPDASGYLFNLTNGYFTSIELKMRDCYTARMADVFHMSTAADGTAPDNTGSHVTDSIFDGVPFRVVSYNPTNALTIEKSVFRNVTGANAAFSLECTQTGSGHANIQVRDSRFDQNQYAAIKLTRVVNASFVGDYFELDSTTYDVPYVDLRDPVKTYSIAFEHGWVNQSNTLNDAGVGRKFIGASDSSTGYRGFSFRMISFLGTNNLDLSIFTDAELQGPIDGQNLTARRLFLGLPDGGAPVIGKPTISGSIADGGAASSIAKALSDLGLVNNSVTP